MFLGSGERMESRYLVGRRTVCIIGPRTVTGPAPEAEAGFRRFGANDSLPAQLCSLKRRWKLKLLRIPEPGGAAEFRSGRIPLERTEEPCASITIGMPTLI